MMSSISAKGIIMATHYTQTKACRNLNLLDLASLSEDEAYNEFKRARWHASNGEPVCPECGCFNPLVYRYRRIFRCRACRKEFSATSGTLWAYRKMPFKKLIYLMAKIVVPSLGANSIEHSTAIACQPMSAFIMAHKIREAMISQTADVVLDNIVEIDGMYTGKYRRKTNYKENRIDLRKSPSAKKLNRASQL
jgi:transposase-like protein